MPAANERREIFGHFGFLAWLDGVVVSPGFGPFLLLLASFSRSAAQGTSGASRSCVAMDAFEVQAGACLMMHANFLEHAV